MNKLDKKNLHKEIDLIQGCIKRMASNSFLLKGWAISIVAVVLALSEKGVNPFILCLVALVPLISFWYLDAFFLYTEKLYRKMYNWVIEQRLQSNGDYMYDLNPHRFKTQLKVEKWNKEKKIMEQTDRLESEWTAMWSKTLKCFYFIPIALIVVIFIVLLIIKGTTFSEAKKAEKKGGFTKEFVKKTAKKITIKAPPKKIEVKEKSPQIKDSGNSNAAKVVKTQTQSIEVGRNQQSDTKIHRADGKIRAVNSDGNAPSPPKDRK